MHLSVALTAGVLLAAGIATPARAADPAPADVRIGWKDAAHTDVRVTWTETTAQPNAVTVRYASGSVVRTVHVAADAPNELDLPASLIASDQATIGKVLQIGVAVGTAAGDTSPVTLSRAFDTNEPAYPSLDTYSLSGGSTLSVRWKAGYARTDTTPDDPLDIAESETYAPQYVKDDRIVAVGEPTRSSSLTFTGPRPPFEFQVVARNEWSTRLGAQVFATAVNPTASMPAWVQVDSAQNRVSGSLGTSLSTRVLLQARNSATSPWYTVGWSDFTDGRYAFDLGMAGSRQYRVQVPNFRSGEWAVFGGFSPVVSTTVQVRAGAHFWQDPVRVGQTSRAALYLRPNLVGNARLERWNGKAWTLVGPVPIANGLGFGSVRGATPGRVAYRYYVPAGTIRGQYFAAAYSNTFVLTTTR